MGVSSRERLEVIVIRKVYRFLHGIVAPDICPLFMNDALESSPATIRKFSLMYIEKAQTWVLGPLRIETSVHVILSVDGNKLSRSVAIMIRVAVLLQSLI